MVRGCYGVLPCGSLEGFCFSVSRCGRLCVCVCKLDRVGREAMSMGKVRFRGIVRVLRLVDKIKK